MKKLSVLVLLLVFVNVCAQSDTHEQFEAAGISSITIHTNEVYSIRIITANVETIQLTTHSEGEYSNQIVVRAVIENDQLKIDTNYPQELTGGYDKLSAHKVFSMELELKIPKDLDVSVSSNIASLITTGSFKQLMANLKGGYCHLKDFDGKATVNTYRGNIHVETSWGLVDAASRNGIVNIEPGILGRNPIRLRTIDGDIKVLKTK